MLHPARGGWLSEQCTRDADLADRDAPDFAKGQLSLGVLFEVTGNRRRALRELNAAVAADPQFAEGHFRLAQVLRQSGRLDAALRHFKTSVELEPGRDEARLDYARALAAAGVREVRGLTAARVVSRPR